MPGYSKFKRFTITAALPYANGPIHIGHLSGVYIPADMYVRYLRMKKQDVVFVCGSDEHGVPITIRARKENVTPQEIVDKYHKLIAESFEEFGISFDIYHRTSSPIHHKTASDFFTKLNDHGTFVEKSTEQYYDVKSGQFLADRYIKGTCPRCNFPEAYGDQCENCGSTLSPSDLINPRSMLSGEKPVLKDTMHWYLPLDQFESWLKQWILEEHKEWKTNVFGQCKSWLDNGLNPRAVTRDLDWGIPVPLTQAEGKVLYVWFDAPIGYISATKQWALDHGKDWELYWKSKDTRLVHFIGKDNIVFHCLIFPSMLKAHGEYVLPDNVPANEFLNLESDKISTSRNWAVWLHEYMADFPGKTDVLRYVLGSNMPETKDNDFTWKDFQAKNNNELVAILGNFVNRALVLTHKYFDGKVPPSGKMGSPEKELLKKINSLPDEIADSLENFRFREALGSYIEIARLGNKYLADTEPWKVIRDNRERAGTILHMSLVVAVRLGIFGEPFL
ncbi:MAG TPA: methionine--tRNA ligase, partial [Cyclobacteriaceae bacterium]|nr:methionine--tRNA ligase [Cyclobacteriaceae bacterium]